MRLPVLLAIAILSAGCIGGAGGYTFDQGMGEMNSIINKYNDAQTEPELLKMRGELFDFYTTLEKETYSEDVGALRLVLLFRINFYDGKMMQNAAKREMDDFAFECKKVEHFRQAELQYGEFIKYSEVAATNLEALIQTYPTQAERADMDMTLVTNIRMSAERTKTSLETSQAQVEQACGGNSTVP